MTPNETVDQVVNSQHAFFDSDATKDPLFRKEQLKKLLQALKSNEAEILDALHADLGKSNAESYMTEVAMAKEEIETQIKDVEEWSRPKNVPANLVTMPSRSTVYYEPFGTVLIIVPWNYPINLSLTPLAGAMAAGNTVVMKCSRNNRHLWPVLQKILNHTFASEYVYAVDADSDYDTVLLQKYDYIFFTGGPSVGKTIMKAAAENLTPVSLELGGKSPCFVDEKANLKIAAKRITWGKFMNAGQTCISIDYVLVQNSVKAAFIAEMKKAIDERYSHALDSDRYPCIISDKEYNRLIGLLKSETTIIGGGCDAAKRKIEPTLLPETTYDSSVMQEEIFGPILPIIGYEDLDETLHDLKKKPRPLACYVFTEDNAVAQKVIHSLLFGGGCVNDVMMHISNNNLPFGGVGNSGMGAYHGAYSFQTFSHMKGIVSSSTSIDVPLRYAPYDEKKYALLKKII